MGEVIDMEERLPHKVSEAICVKCLNRWISVRPESLKLKEMYCPYCEEKGYIIETGEELEYVQT